MTGFLLDTSVLSLLAPGRPDLPTALAAWLRANSDRLFISTITIAEIEQGIAKLRRNDNATRATGLASWLEALIVNGADRILDFDVAAASIAGQLSDAATAQGRHPGFADVAIAAIARSRDLTLLTANGRHFDPLGVRHADPSSSDFLAAQTARNK